MLPPHLPTEFATEPGGIIAYFVLQHDDPQKAKNCLMLGAVLLVIHIALAYVLPR